MPRLKKKTREMTDNELLHDIFPKEVIREAKKIARAALKKSKVKFHRAR